MAGRLVRAIDLSLSAAIHSGRLLGVVQLLRAERCSVVVDFATLSDRDAAGLPGCSKVGKGGPASPTLSRLMARIGVGYAGYFSCAVESDAVFETAAAEALLTQELRLRVFRDPPTQREITSWDTSRFWEAGSGLPEEEAADLVVAAVNGGTRFMLRGDEDILERMMVQFGG